MDGLYGNWSSMVGCWWFVVWWCSCFRGCCVVYWLWSCVVVIGLGSLVSWYWLGGCDSVSWLVVVNRRMRWLLGFFWLIWNLYWIIWCVLWLCFVIVWFGCCCRLLWWSGICLVWNFLMIVGLLFGLVWWFGWLFCCLRRLLCFLCGWVFWVYFDVLLGWMNGWWCICSLGILGCWECLGKFFWYIFWCLEWCWSGWYCWGYWWWSYWFWLRIYVGWLVGNFWLVLIVLVLVCWCDWLGNWIVLVFLRILCCFWFCICLGGMVYSCGLWFWCCWLVLLVFWWFVFVWFVGVWYLLIFLWSVFWLWLGGRLWWGIVCFVWCVVRIVCLCIGWICFGWSVVCSGFCFLMYGDGECCVFRRWYWWNLVFLVFVVGGWMYCVGVLVFIFCD